jgi:hypothetical protein
MATKFTEISWRQISADSLAEKDIKRRVCRIQARVYSGKAAYLHYTCYKAALSNSKNNTGWLAFRLQSQLHNKQS